MPRAGGRDSAPSMPGRIPEWAAPAAMLRPRLSVSSASCLLSASAATPGKWVCAEARLAWACLGLGCVGDTAGPGGADGESLRRERGDCLPSRGGRPRAWAPERGPCPEAQRLGPNSFSFTELPKMCNPGRSGVSHREGKLPVYPVAATFP